MKPHLTVLWTAIFLAFGLGTTLATEWGEQGTDFANDKLIVSLKPGNLILPPDTSEAALDKCDVGASLLQILLRNNVIYVKRVFTRAEPGDTIRLVDGGPVRVPDLSNVFTLLQHSGSLVINAVTELWGFEGTLYAEPCYFALPYTDPNDTYWSQQWNLKNPDPLQHLFGIGCPKIWECTAGKPSVRVAVVDEGIDYTHHDLGGPGHWNVKVAGGYDYAESDDDPLDVCGHGTRCAGVIGALTNNGQANGYIAGIAGGWQGNPFLNPTGVSLYAIKVGYDDCVSHWQADVIANAIRDAADPDVFACRVLNNSYGLFHPEDYQVQVVRDAVKWAYVCGASFVAAMGNAGHNNSLPGNESYPSDYDEHWVTAVGGYDMNGKWFNWGGHGSNWGANIDILAPWGAPTTARVSEGGYDPDFGGTSSSAAQASGLVALLRSYYTNLYNDDTDWMLKFSAWDPPSGWDPQHGNPDGNVWTWNDHYGHGLIRASTVAERMNKLTGQSPWKLLSGTASGNVTYTLEREHAQWDFRGSPLNGTYYDVDQYKVSVPVTYAQAFVSLPYVWGLGHGTAGWSPVGEHLQDQPPNANLQEGYCQVTANSPTITGCVLHTYVYYIWDELRWYPCQPEDVVLQYRLWGIPKGDITPRGPDEGKKTVAGFPERFTIEGNYPNPFNLSTVIKISCPQDGRVSLSIYDVLGREVHRIDDREVNAGRQELVWTAKDDSGNDLPSGLYFCRAQAGGQIAWRKLLLIR